MILEYFLKIFRLIMKAYWLARSKILDPIKYKKYTDQVPFIISKFGGKILARGGNFKILEGTDKFHRFVIIEFPTLKDGENCWRSEEYRKASLHRKNGAGEVDLILVEEGDATE
jgi:uncharacterized protein (DUF1330 family)